MSNKYAHLPKVSVKFSATVAPATKTKSKSPRKSKLNEYMTLSEMLLEINSELYSELLSVGHAPCIIFGRIGSEILDCWNAGMLPNTQRNERVSGPEAITENGFRGVSEYNPSEELCTLLVMACEDYISRVQVQ